jgi:type II secretory pathway component PulK
MSRPRRPRLSRHDAARRARRRGFVLVLVLWFIILLLTIAVSLSYQMRVGMKVSSYGRRQLQAIALARAGLAKATLDLKNDRLMAAADPLFNNDTPLDVWATIDDKTDVPLGRGTYTVRVLDDERKLDLQAINPTNQLALVYLLTEICRLDDDEALEAVEAYIDYVDPDNQAVRDIELTESDYYTEWALKNLGDQVPPDFVFMPKNEPVTRVEELLQVPGFTWEMLYGDPAETPADPLVRADSEERSTALIDYLTIGTSGRVNLNTASLPILEAMLHAASSGEGNIERWADDIVKLREDLLRGSDAGGRGIIDPTQIQAAGIDENVLGAMTAMFRLSQSSYFFTVISRGDVEGVRSTRSLRCYVELQRYPLDPEIDFGYGRRELKGFGFLESQENFKIDPEVRVDRLWEQ